jgi:hypothetical protein
MKRSTSSKKALTRFSYKIMDKNSIFVLSENDYDYHLLVTKGIEKKFIDLSFALYKPFLNRGHLKDRHQLTIWINGKLAGFIHISSKNAHFMQISLVPGIRKKDIARNSLFRVAEKLNYRKIGWTAQKSNYPSLKLLYNLGGGVCRGSLNKSSKKAEGSFSYEKPAHKSMIENLESLLPESRRAFDDWRELYGKRQSEMSALQDYLKTLNPGTKM